MSLNVSRDEMLKGNIFKGLIKLALPLMFLNLINTLYGIVDTYFVGKIGELQVGAVSLITPITSCGAAFATGLSAAGISMIARSLGSNNKEKANDIITHLIIIAVLLGIVITAFSLIFTNNILSWLKTPSDIYEDTKGYLVGISLDYVFLFILTIFHAVRQADGDSKTGSIVNIVASILNAILDPIFIFTFNFGTFGAAIATVLSKAIMCPFAIYSLIKSDSVKLVLNNFKLKLSLMLSILKVSLPASLGQFLSSFGFVLMSKEIVSYGSIVMSAYGIGSHISAIFYIPVNGIGTALSTFIAQNLGAKNIDRSHECYSKAMLLSVIISIIVMIVGIPSAKYFVLLFVNNASDRLLALSLEYARFSIGTSIFMGWFNNLCGVFNGSTNTKIAMVLSAARILIIRMPIVYLLARFTNLEYTGIWCSMILSNLITCIIGQIEYKAYPWDKNAVIF